MGLPEEASEHLDSGGSTYKVFVRCKNPKILNMKFNWWEDPDRVEGYQENHDGVWVKSTYGESVHHNNSTNLQDLICFDPDNILVVDVE